MHLCSYDPSKLAYRDGCIFGDEPNILSTYMSQREADRSGRLISLSAIIYW
jgi:hypothetical protein